MQMRHAAIETLAPAATYVATGTSCRWKSSGFLRPDTNPALTRRCFR
jgi:hypothetical protein